jgi:hypothetical protein
MDAEELAFEERPNTFSRIGVNIAAEANVLALRMIDRKMCVVAIKADERPIFVGQYSRAPGDVLENLSLKRLGFGVRDMNSPKLAFALDNTEHNGLVCAALRARRPLIHMFVLFLAANDLTKGFGKFLRKLAFDGYLPTLVGFAIIPISRENFAAVRLPAG